MYVAKLQDWGKVEKEELLNNKLQGSFVVHCNPTRYLGLQSNRVEKLRWGDFGSSGHIQPRSAQGYL